MDFKGLEKWRKRWIKEVVGPPEWGASSRNDPFRRSTFYPTSNDLPNRTPGQEDPDGWWSLFKEELVFLSPPKICPYGIGNGDLQRPNKTV